MFYDFNLLEQRTEVFMMFPSCRARLIDSIYSVLMYIDLRLGKCLNSV